MSNAFDKANSYYLDKKYEDAIRLYEKIEPSNIDYATALYNKGVCILKLHKYKEAIEVFKEVLEINPNHQKSVFNLGYCFATIEDLKSALRYFNRAWALDNDDKSCEKAINLVLRNYTKGMRA